MALLVATTMGCRKPKPSPEYAEAAGLHSTLVAGLGDEAYGDERMERVEALLAKVPADSADASAAAELVHLISRERRRIAQEAAAHAKQLEAAAAPVAAAAPPPQTLPPDTVPAGMTLEQLQQAGDCFMSTGPVTLHVEGAADVTGERYERRDAGACAERFTRYEGRVLVFSGGKLVGNFDRAELVPGR